VKSFFLLFTLSLIFISCGYKPTSIYTKQILGDKLYTEVKISLKDPENSVLIKDAINEAVVSQFRSKISSKKDANSKLYITLNTVKFMPIQYDKNGYVIAYKTYVGLKSEYVDINGNRSSLNSKGDYDFPIESNSLISDTKRFEAIKFASQKALDELQSLIAIKAIK
jgi:hypothetical protein